MIIKKRSEAREINKMRGLTMSSFFTSSTVCLVCLVCTAAAAVATADSKHQRALQMLMANIGAPPLASMVDQNEWLLNTKKLQQQQQEEEQQEQRTIFSKILTTEEYCINRREECRTGGRHSEIISSCQSGLVLVKNHHLGGADHVNCVPVSVFSNSLASRRQHEAKNANSRNELSSELSAAAGAETSNYNNIKQLIDLLEERKQQQLQQDEDLEARKLFADWLVNAQHETNARHQPQTQPIATRIIMNKKNDEFVLPESRPDLDEIISGGVEQQQQKRVNQLRDGGKLRVEEEEESGGEPNKEGEGADNLIGPDLNNADSLNADLEERRHQRPSMFGHESSSSAAAVDETKPMLIKKSHSSSINRKMPSIGYGQATAATTTQANTIRVSAEQAKRFIEAQLGANQASLIYSTTAATTPLLPPGYLMARPPSATRLQQTRLDHQRDLYSPHYSHRHQQSSLAAAAADEDESLPPNDLVASPRRESSSRRGPIRLHRSETVSSSSSLILSADKNNNNQTNSGGDQSSQTNDYSATLVDADGGRLLGNNMTASSSSSQSASSSLLPKSAAADKLREWEELQCNKRRFTFRATKRDSEGNYCTGLVASDICYGACDTGEIADWLFPYKRSIHKVCRHGQRVRRKTRLLDCSSQDVDESLHYYHYVDALDCVCKKCTSIDTTCLGTMTTPRLQHMDEALKEFEQDVFSVKGD